ncbi:hypothetical protein K435DRAFT_626775, partial [Dendrothele bispora CBS 962.96]
IEKCRAQALNPALTGDYFEELQYLIHLYKIKLHHVYNMDEKGAMMGKGERVMVFVDRDQKEV